MLFILITFTIIIGGIIICIFSDVKIEPSVKGASMAICMLLLGIIWWGMGSCWPVDEISWIEYKQIIKPGNEYVMVMENNAPIVYRDASIVNSVKDKEWVPFDMTQGINIYHNSTGTRMKFHKND